MKSVSFARCIHVAIVFAGWLSAWPLAQAGELLAGSGTVENPYVIASFADFATFAELANAGIYWGQGVHTRLLADIDLDPGLEGRVVYNRAVIAPDTDAAYLYQGTPFKGVFDGNGRTIANLTLDAGADAADYLGLFGRLSGASVTVKNLRLEGASVVGSGKVTYAGVLAGEAAGTIENCHTSGEVSGGNSSMWLGGLCGFGNFATFRGCSSAGSVAGGSDVRWLGGLCGKFNRGSAEECWSNAAVTGGANARFMGGFAGAGEATPVQRCFSTGTVTGGGGSQSLGGFYGNTSYSSDVLTDCYATGDVIGDGSFYVGGFIGDLYYGQALRCYSTGRVVNPGRVAWGFCGSTFVSTVVACFWDVQASGMATSQGGMGVDTVAMQELATFQPNGWDNGAWRLDAGNDYPRLAYEGTSGKIIPGYVAELAGEGTAAVPFAIHSRDDFLELRRGTFYWDKHYELFTDVDLDGEVFAAALLGFDADNPFRGVFDGRGHRVVNLNMAATLGYVGLFAAIGTGGEVRDLEIAEAAVAGSGGGKTVVGILCGLNKGSVEGCRVAGSVQGDNAASVGGLCGENAGTVRTSLSRATVQGHGAQRLGGLSGFSNYSTTENCYATGSVTGNGASYAGGLCGRSNTGDFVNCYSTGRVSGTGITYRGGLIGYGGSPPTVTACFWDMETSGILAGGGVGTAKTTAQMQQRNTYSPNGWDNGLWRLDDDNDYPRLAYEGTPGVPMGPHVPTLVGAGTAENPYQIHALEDFLELGLGFFYWNKHYTLHANLDLGEQTFGRALLGVDTTAPFTGVFNGQGQVISNFTINGESTYSGLFGVLGEGGEIRNLGLDNASVTIAGVPQHVGILCGFNNRGLIEQCYTSGTVTVGDGGNYVGGLCGRNEYATMRNCYTTAAVTGGNGVSHIGGLVGASHRGTLAYCYSAGALTGGNNTNPGGLVGWNSSTVTACYWDVTVSGVLNSGAGFGLNSVQMRRQSWFEDNGWDFDEVWQVSGATGYPGLRWQPNKGLLAPRNRSVLAGVFEAVWHYTDPGEDGVVAAAVYLDDELLLAAAVPDAGSLEIDSTVYADGWHELSGRFEDADGAVVLSSERQILTLNAPAVRLHSGNVTEDTLWDADAVHVITGTVIVQAGATLAVAPGAVVKFIDYSAMEVRHEGRLVINGVILTHFADDTAGGDTNLDGDLSRPRYGLWELTGTGTIVTDEHTELRYARVTLAGTLPASQTLVGRRVYHITANLVVPNGVLLTVAPGAILKFAPGTSLIVQNGGTLNAIGSRAQPIVLTSFRDDAWGGDTNGDGDISWPAPGNWHQVNVAGTANFEHTRILYCSMQNNQGGLQVSGGTITFDNSVIAHTQFDAVRNSGGTFLARNSVFRDNSLAIRPEAGESRLTNCILYDVATAVRGPNGIFVNCVFADVAQVFEEWGPSTFRHCAFWNQPGFGPQTVSQVGSDGNIWAEPLFRDAPNGDFSLRAGSALIDAGDGDAAPETDFLGQPRVDDPYVANTGTPAPNGGIPDIGIYELAAGLASDRDLAASTVVGPDAANVGGTVEVRWRLSNVGTAPVVGPWRDRLTLVGGAGLAGGAREVEVATQVVDAMLEPGEGIEIAARVVVPPVEDGDWHWVVQTNAWRDVFEGILVENNVAASVVPMQVGNAALRRDEPVAAALEIGQTQAFRFEQTVGVPLMLRLTGDRVRMLVGYGRMPAPESFAATANPDGVLLLPPADEDRTVYVLLMHERGGPTGFELTLTGEAFALIAVGVATAGDEADVLLPLSGTGFAEGMTVVLRSAGGRMEIVADPITIYNSTDAVARFDLRGQPSGAWDVVGELDGDAAILPGVFNLVAGAVGIFEARLDTPDSLRQGRYSTAWVEYANIGNAPMNAPVLILHSRQVRELRLSPDDSWRNTSLKFLALSGTHPVGILKPGERQRIPFYFRTPAEATNVHFSLQSYVPNDKLVAWGALIPILRPPSAMRTFPQQDALPSGRSGGRAIGGDGDEQRWAVMWENVVSQIGNTWGELLAALAENATYLARQGQTTRSLPELLDFELRQTTGFGIPGIVYGATDAVVTSPQGEIRFARWTPPGVGQRFRIAGFGFGWTHSYDYEMRRRSETIRLYTPGGGVRAFFKTGATWTGMPWDPGVFRKEGTDYILHERRGEQLRFNWAGRLIETVDAYGNSLSLIYDDFGGLVRMALADGRGLDFDLSDGADCAAGLITAVTDADGRVTTYAYNDHMQMTEAVSADGRLTRFTCIPPVDSLRDHLITQIEFPDGARQFYAYDASGRLLRRWRDGDAYRLTYAYGEGGQVTETDLSGETKTTFYGISGRLLSQTDPLGRTESFNYDAAGRVLRHIMPGERMTTVTRDAGGQITQLQNPAGQQVTFAYDGAYGALSMLSDAHRNRVRYQNNTSGDVTEIINQDDSANLYAYDVHGNIVASWNRRGQRISYAWDARGKLVSKTWLDATGAEERRFDYLYDARGNLIQAGDSLTGLITMEYDEHDRLARMVYPNGKWLDFTWDAFGRRRARLDQDGRGELYVYDAFSRLHQVRTQDDALLMQYTYDALGRVPREDRGNGSYATYAFDAAGRVAEINHHGPDGTRLAWFHYAYDTAGNVRSMTAKDPDTGGDAVTHYRYDALGQLTDVLFPNGDTARYTYDAAGNRTIVEENGVATAFFTNALNQYTRVGEAVHTYDLDGNLVRIESPAGIQTFAYDHQNRLTSVIDTDGAILNFTSDALGRRYRRQQNGETTLTVSDPQWLGYPAADYAADGTLRQRHVLGAGIVASIDAAGHIQHLAADLAGNVRLVTDPAGASVEAIDYGPFGALRGGGTATPFLFGGAHGVRQEAPGLYHMRNREFSARQGRFLQSDPVGLFGGVNFYAYCGNNPISRIDPSGLGDEDYNFIRSWRNVVTRRGLEDLNDRNYEQVMDRQRENSRQYWRDADRFGRDLAEIQPTRRPKKISDLKKIFLFFYDFMRDFFEVLDEEDDDRDRDDDDEDDDDYRRRDRERERDRDRDDDDGDRDDEDGDDMDVPRSCDPNALEGPLGFGDPDSQRFVLPGQWMNYIVFFENKPDATAPAQEVWVTNPLSEHLDWTTLELGAVVFNNQTELGLAGQSAGTLEVAQQGAGLNVRIEFNLETNPATGQKEAKWYLRSVDPTTFDGWPEDPYAGFLPPNDDNPDDEGQPGDAPGAPHCGEGHLAYRIRLKDTVLPGTRIDNAAEIVFDYNPMIPTDPAWFNTVAGDPPAVPAGTFPLPGAIGVPLRPTHTWSATELATAYDIYRWTPRPPRRGGESRDEPVRPHDLAPQATTTVQFFTHPANLLPDTTYAWQLVARNVFGETPGLVWTYTTGLSAVAQSGILDGAGAISTRPEFSWDPHPGADHYDLYLWPSGTDVPALPLGADLTGTTWIPSQALDPWTTYRWRVVAKSATNQSCPQEAWRFTTGGGTLRWQAHPQWNLFSLPFPLPATFANLAAVLAGDRRDIPAAQGAWSWDATYAAYRQIDIPNPGQGFWSFRDAAGSAQAALLDGTEAAESAVVLTPGWNLVGPPKNIALGELPLPAGWRIGAAYSWDTDLQGYRPIAGEFLLERGRAYWIVLQPATGSGGL